MMSKLDHLPRRFCLLSASLALALGWAPSALAATAGNPPARPEAPSAAATDAGPLIGGFRNAHFGMTQMQVRAAVIAEFKLPASAITHSLNATQHTEVLTADIPNLIPSGGLARVSYVFGYQTHKLIEVNVLWAKSVDPKATPALLYQNGESLQQYFAGEGFPPQRSTGNIATSSGLLLFRATDTNANVVLLVLSGKISKDPKATDKSFLDPAALTLVYAMDPQHPDVFHLGKGSF